MQDTEARPPTPDVPLPHRINLDDPHQHGIVLGHHREYTSLISWCRTMAPQNARPLIQVARALVDNARQHSRSGLPGGQVRVVLDQSRPQLVHLYVTDQGPLDADSVPYPRMSGHAPGSGLALVERFSVYWDFAWAWDGNRFGPLTVDALLDLTATR